MPRGSCSGGVSRHLVSYAVEDRLLVRCCHRARCTCGWSSDSYASFDDARRAAVVHLRQARREDFDAVIARSSIGAALRDIEERGIDAHAADLAREMRRPSQRRKKERR
jgi:hypothetical protein